MDLGVVEAAVIAVALVVLVGEAIGRARTHQLATMPAHRSRGKFSRRWSTRRPQKVRLRRPSKAKHAKASAENAASEWIAAGAKGAGPTAGADSVAVVAAGAAVATVTARSSTRAR